MVRIRPRHAAKFIVFVFIIAWIYFIYTRDTTFIIPKLKASSSLVEVVPNNGTKDEITDTKVNDHTITGNGSEELDEPNDSQHDLKATDNLFRSNWKLKHGLIMSPSYKSRNIQQAFAYLMNDYNSSTRRIPKLIHQQYKSKELSDERISDVKTFENEALNGFKYLFWTDEELLFFVNEFYPHLQTMYSAFKLPVLRADLARYLLLETFGGAF